MEAYSDYLAGLISGGQPGGCPASGQWQAPDVLIIREKALEEAAYLALFQKVWEKSNPLRMKEGGDFLSDIEKRPMLIPHTYVSAARQAGTDAIHLPFALFQKYHGTGKLEGITHIGVSIHAPEEAARAQEEADAVTAKILANAGDNTASMDAMLSSRNALAKDN